MASMNLRDVALEVARILEDVGKHAYQDQLNPRDMASMMVLGIRIKQILVLEISSYDLLKIVLRT